MPLPCARCYHAFRALNQKREDTVLSHSFFVFCRERYIAWHTGMEGCSVVIKNKARLNSAAPFTFKDMTRDTGFLLSKEQGLAAIFRMEVLGWCID